MPKKKHPSDGSFNLPLGVLVNEYKEVYREDRQAELRWWAGAPTLHDAILRATESKLENGKWNRHQRRIKASTLKLLSDCLLGRIEQVSKVKSFSKLYELVGECGKPIAGIGPLAIYDIAVRIGSFQKITPTDVYLQSGSLQGYRNLGLSGRPTNVSPRVFPSSIAKLSPQEIEDFLCVYENQLSAQHT